MDAAHKSITPGLFSIRPARMEAEKSPEEFYRLLNELRSPDCLPLKRIAEICGDTSLNPEPNILRKIQNRTLSERARAAVLAHIFDDEAVLFRRSRQQASAIDHSLYFSFLNFLEAKDAAQDEARARVVGTYKLWRHALDLDDELVLGKLTVFEDPHTRALRAQVAVSRKSTQGVRGSHNPFSGYMFFISRMYFMINRDSRTDDVRMTLFPRFRLDEVGTDINPRSVFVGRNHHIAHMDGLTLGMDGSRAFVSPTHVSLVDDVDDLERLDQLLDVVPHDDDRAPPRIVKRLMRCGPLRVL